MLALRSSQFTVRMSRDTYSGLKRFLQDKSQSIVMNVIQEHLYVDMYEGVPRNKAQVDSTAGAMEGEANRQGNTVLFLHIMYKERPGCHGISATWFSRACRWLDLWDDS